MATIDFKDTNKEPLIVLQEVLKSDLDATYNTITNNIDTFLKSFWYAELIKQNNIISNADFFLLENWNMEDIILFYSNIPTANNLCKLLGVIFGSSFVWSISRVSHKYITITNTNGMIPLNRVEYFNLVNEEPKNITNEEPKNIIAEKSKKGLTIENLVNLFFILTPFNTKYKLNINGIEYNNYENSN